MLRPVQQDGAGVEFAGLPPLGKAGEPVRLGGMLDTVTGLLVGPSRDPIVWYVGAKQLEILLREDPDASRILLYSAEGGGKTVLMAQWVILQIIRAAARGDRGAGGATAPTGERLLTLVKAIRARVPIDTPLVRKPGSWGTVYAHEREIRFASRFVLQLRSTKPYSAATGPVIQGLTWRFSGDDELQDTAENDADPDIEARLRGARVSYRMCTATAKDSPNWRTFRDGKIASPDWAIERIRYDETPFVWPEHWARMQRNMSEREWARRGLALDVAPERAVYTAWDRDRNLRPIPDLGATDVTSEVLRDVTGDPTHSLLIGHDPGKIQDVSILLKAFRFHGEAEHVWYVVDEYVTKGTTTEEHCAGLLQHVRDKWRMNLLAPSLNSRAKQELDPYGPKVHVRIDPYGHTDNEKPDESVLRQFNMLKMHARSAAYKGPKGSGWVPKEARISMVNRLLKSAAGNVRLVIACDDKRQPCAPGLTHSIEMSSRDGDGKAETRKKSDKTKDLSDFGCALGYGLYRLERLTAGDPAWRAAN